MPRLLDPAQDNAAHVHQRLTSEPMIWLSTVTPNGHPHLVPVWFSWDDPTIWVFSVPGTQKLANLQHNQAVTLALDTAHDGGDVVLVHGTADLPTPAETSAAATPTFSAKYGQRVGPDGIEGWASLFQQPIRVTVHRVVSWISTPTGLRTHTFTPQP